MTKGFNVGDRVKIREWDDMAQEYGLSGGSINCRCTFVPAMKVFCGREFIITHIYEDGEVHGHALLCHISTDMIELVEGETKIEFDNTEVNKFLDQFNVM